MLLAKFRFDSTKAGNFAREYVCVAVSFFFSFASGRDVIHIGVLFCICKRTELEHARAHVRKASDVVEAKDERDLRVSPFQRLLFCQAGLSGLAKPESSQAFLDVFIE